MRRSSVIAGAIAGVALAAAASFVTVKMFAVAGAAEAAIYRETGLSFSYSGLPGISLWPDTAVTLDDVALATPQSGRPVVAAPEIRLKLDRILTWDEPAIASIVLTDPQINMTIGRDGKPGWVFGKKAEAAPPPELSVRLTNGHLTYLDERTGFTFTVDEIEADTTVSGMDGEFNAKGGVVWNKEPINFTLFLKSLRRLSEDGSPIDLNFSSPSLTLALSGRAATAQSFSVTGQATAKSDDLRLLALWLGNKLSGSRGFANFEMSGSFEASPQAIAFRKGRFSLDDMHGQGDLLLTNGAGRLRIDANLGLDRIDLNVYRGAEPYASALTLLEDRWSTDPLSFEALKNMDARLRLAANQIDYGELKTGPARVSGDLKNGILDLRLDDISLYGGTAAARLRLDGRNALPAVALSFAGTHLDSEPALRGAMSFGKVAGSLSTSFSATTLGSSVAEMVSRLAGSGSFRITDGSITDLDLPAVIHQAAESIQDGWPLDPSRKTPFEALSGSYTIEDGIIAIQDLALASPQLAITLRGEIDIARQALDLASESRLATEQKTSGKAPSFATFPVPVIFKGRWISPRIYPDVPGILDDPQTAFRALKKLGLGTATVETSGAPPAN